MKINRHNYEECFILYWDNELSAAEKLEVENFVNDNPDLKEEFQIFGETRFTPDSSISFSNKHTLQFSTPLDSSETEGRLISYIDNELKGEEKLEMERLIAADVAIQKELEIFQKTKIHPDTSVVFPDKSVLYRHEEKVRVVRLTWLRVAVAAAIILMAGVITFRVVKTTDSGDKEQIANVEKGSNPLPQKTEMQKIQEPNTLTLAKNDEQPAPASVQKKNIIKEQIRTDEDKLSDQLAINTSGNKNNLPKEGSGKLSNSIAGTTVSVADMADNSVPSVTRKELGNVAKNDFDATAVSFNNSDVTLQPGYALKIETPSDIDPVFEEKDGGGLKQFLRKTTRVFERRTKIQTTTEDNKLLLGAFAVSLK